MTTFDKTATSAETKQEEAKAEEQSQQLVSRLKASPAMWNDALNLCDLLSYCRPHLSGTEQRFIHQHIKPIGIKFDKKGNMYKKIGNAPVLWSCHIDTVHSKKGMQKLEYWVDAKSGDTFLGVAKGEKSSCLGADDTSGVWIMLEMIKAKVPGLYVFHRGEECGGVGSRWIAKNNADVLKDIRFAIAFDRRDTESIITFQGSKRCCSDEFAKSLAEQLGMNHRCDETGMWTDTASYVDHVAECTNISAGYFNAHSANESVNVDYLFRLRDAICKVDLSKLIEKRKPGENTERFQRHYYFDEHYNSHWWSKRSYQRPENGFTGMELNDKYGFNTWQKWFDWDHISAYWIPRKGATIPKDAEKVIKKDLGVTKGWKQDTAHSTGQWEAVRMIRDNPLIIADLLETQGYGPLEIKDCIVRAGGYLHNDQYWMGI